MIEAIITTDSIEYISKTDPAVDHLKSDFGKYADTNDESHLVLREGTTPTRWKLRPLSQTQVRRAMGTAMVDGHGTAMLMEVGARLLSVGLVGARDFGDGKKVPRDLEWPTGISAEVLETIPANTQLDLGEALYRLCNGPTNQTGLEDEGKSPSPSSSKGQGNSTKSASSAPTATKTKANAGGGGARSLRKSKS